MNLPHWVGANVHGHASIGLDVPKGNGYEIGVEFAIGAVGNVDRFRGASNNKGGIRTLVEKRSVGQGGGGGTDPRGGP